MSEKIIKIFVEGDSDERFIKWVINCYYNVLPVQYQQKPNRNINTYINQAKAKENQDYIFLADLDSHSYPCTTSKKEKRSNEYCALDDMAKIIIVKEEIESWYISGLSDECPEDLKGISVPDDTQNFTKEDFEKVIPPKFEDSKINFMIEICKCYNIELARNRNDSFNRFIKQLEQFNTNY